MTSFGRPFARASFAITAVVTASAMATSSPTAKSGLAIPAGIPSQAGAVEAIERVSSGGDGIGKGIAEPGFTISAAEPFQAGFVDNASPARALECLTQAIYYEGATEPGAGQQAIAQVVLNRVSHSAFPSTVCGVVYEGAERTTGCQFTFTCDGSLARRPSELLWARARRTAQAALGGFVAEKVGRATHYHADYVDPYWSSSLDRIDKIGVHIFYVWKGSAGRPEAFASDYAGVEPDTSGFAENASVKASAAVAASAAAAGESVEAISDEAPSALPEQPGEPAAPEEKPKTFRPRPLMLEK